MKFNRAEVSIQNISKKSPSTFFPDHWSPSKIESEIRGAFENRAMLNERKWTGTSTNGHEIEGYLDRFGNINTAYPTLR